MPVDGDVVYVVHERLGQRRGQGPIAQAESPAAGLEVNDDLAIGERSAHRGFDLIADHLAFDNRLTRRHGDNRFGEVMTAGLTDPESPQLDRVTELFDGGVGESLRFGGRGVHQHLSVFVDQSGRGSKDDPGHDQRGDRVALMNACSDGDEADEHRDRAGHIAGEVKRVRAQGSRPVLRGPAKRDQHAADVNAESDADDSKHVPVGLKRLPAARQAPNRRDDHDDPAAREDRRLAERAEILRSSVAVRMVAIRRSAAEADGDERQHRCHDIAA